MIPRLLLGLCLAALANAGFASEVETPRSAPFDIALPTDSPLVFRGAVSVLADDEDFGGLSGMVIGAFGQIIAISDRARWATFSLRIENGRLTGIDDLQTHPMITHKGQIGHGRNWDAEGMTLGPDGRLWVSFERVHRLQSFTSVTEPAGVARRTKEWDKLPNNGGLEALATSADGRLWAIEEQSVGAAHSFRVFVSGPSDVEVKHLPRHGEFSPTGADFGPDGWLYITERAFSLIGGFRVRLRRARWSDGAAPVADEQLAAFDAASNIDNIEAITVWEDDDKTYAVVLSDDNFNIFQRTVVALFEVE
ncbi:MAG: esterase-like activity of phytase family protein [Pseudomonadota bacterium]